MRPRLPNVAGRGLDHLVMGLAILGLGAASGMTWKTIDDTIRPRPGEGSRCVLPAPTSQTPRCSPHSGPPWLQPSSTEPPPGNGTSPVEVPCSVAPISPGRVTEDETLGRALPRLPISEVRLHGRPTDPSPPPPPEDAEPRRVRVGDEQGRSLIGKVYGGPSSRVVILPDGRLGWPNGMVYTDEPFRPYTADELSAELRDGPYRHFQVHSTEHYLIFHTCTVGFARQSGVLLESLYRGLSKAFQERGIEVHDAEFPLVAVIFRNETEFREHKEVTPEVQAYYEVLSNRIFFYETRDAEPEAPRLAAMRKPQTVAHEGTHQILHNIGVQPRLARWPLWLAEGLAEFCAPAGTIRGEWAGLGKMNPFHLATLQDLDEPPAVQGRSSRPVRGRIGRDPGRSPILDLVTSEQFTPTDYARAWALTHYLATRRHGEFVAYLKAMSEMPPLTPRSPEEHARDFRQFFGDDLSGLCQQVHRATAAVKRSEVIPHYAVTFEQLVGGGMVRRGTIVSQSPLIIRQWLEGMVDGTETPYEWQASVYHSRSAAQVAAEQWFGRP